MSRNFLLVDPEERPDVLRGLASEVRVKILKALHLRGGLNVNAIAELLQLPQSTVSSNLQILEEAGLVATEKVGRTRTCRLGRQRLDAVTAWILTYQEMVDARLNRLEAFLERTQGDSA